MSKFKSKVKIKFPNTFTFFHLIKLVCLCNINPHLESYANILASKDTNVCLIRDSFRDMGKRLVVHCVGQGKRYWALMASALSNDHDPHYTTIRWIDALLNLNRSLSNTYNVRLIHFAWFTLITWEGVY